MESHDHFADGIVTATSAFDALVSAVGDENADAVICALQTIASFIVKKDGLDIRRFQQEIWRIIVSLAEMTDNAEVASAALRLIAYIQKTDSTIIPVGESPEFLNFCISRAFQEPFSVMTAAVECIIIAVHSQEARDYVMSRVSVRFLHESLISKEESDTDMCIAAMELLRVYVRFPLDMSNGMTILEISKRCLSSPTECLHGPALWIILALVDNCEGVGDFIRRNQFPELVDIGLYWREAEQLVPALRIMLFYFKTGMRLPQRSYFNVIRLLGHKDVNVAMSAYNSIMELIQHHPDIPNNWNVMDFVDTVEDVARYKPFRVRKSAGNLLCTVLEMSGSSVVHCIIEENRLKFFVDLLEIQDLEFQARVLRAIECVIRMSGSMCNRVHDQFEVAGLMDVLELVANESVEGNIMVESFKNVALTAGERSGPSELDSVEVMPPLPRRCIRRCVLREEEDVTVTVTRSRPKLWMK